MSSNGSSVEYPRTRRRSKIEAGKLVLAYLSDPETEEHARQIFDIADSTRLSYSTTRRILLEYFPQSFIYSKIRSGWYTTGKSLNASGGVTDFEAPYNQDALRYLNVLASQWPAKPLSEVLTDALASGKLDELRVLGETLSRAAVETKTLNAVPQKLRR